jgi:protein kinase
MNDRPTAISIDLARSSRGCKFSSRAALCFGQADGEAPRAANCCKYCNCGQAALGASLVMNRYKVTKTLGDGTYGSVLRAQNHSTRELVAIKKMKQKYYSWDECMKLREIQALRKLIHPNIVKLKEVIRENDELFMVFEHLEGNLYEMMKSRTKPFEEAKVRNIMFQVFQALHAMHKGGYFHRDMKPENLLYSGDVIKLADFGLAREIRARPPFTDYVSTRWYRAPEVLLRSHQYNSPIDIWACGGIMAEIYNLRPLFPGASESDQLYKTCLVIGTPTKENWPEGLRLGSQLGYRWPTAVATPLWQLTPTANEEAINLMENMMHWDPNKRLSTGRILAHPYFEAGNIVNAVSNGTTAAASGEGASSAHGRAPALPAQPSGGLAGDALFNTKGSLFDSGNPGTGGKAPSAGKDYTTLPPLQQDSRRGSNGIGSGSGRAQKEAHNRGRYLQQISRYQPGVEATPSSQMPMLPAVQRQTNERNNNVASLPGIAPARDAPKDASLPAIGRWQGR